MIVRSLAALLGLFTLVNLLLSRVSGFDANIYWIDVRMLTMPLGRSMLLVGGAMMLAWALRPAMAPWRKGITIAVFGLLLLITLLNSLTFYVLLGRGVITAAVPLPLSLLMAALLASMFHRLRWKCPAVSRGRAAAQIAITVGAALLLFPLLQMVLLGKTDYRRPADAAVVLGARAYADGRPSDALADRVRTGCELYHAGYVDLLILSGGPGDGDVHETEAMRRMAVELGVPDAAIRRDELGLNTSATASNTFSMLNDSAGRLLVVSHGYHLPRVRMAFHRVGLEVCTVPAAEQYVLRSMPYLMAREVAAFWAYYGKLAWSPAVG